MQNHHFVLAAFSLDREPYHLWYFVSASLIFPLSVSKLAPVQRATTDRTKRGATPGWQVTGLISKWTSKAWQFHKRSRSLYCSENLLRSLCRDISWVQSCVSPHHYLKAMSLGQLLDVGETSRTHIPRTGRRSFDCCGPAHRPTGSPVLSTSFNTCPEPTMITRWLFISHFGNGF